VTTLPPGTAVDHYRVEELVGSGSMGDVYRAVDANLGRRVALKILSERHRDNPELRARFTREARAVAAISHANVVQVFTTGVHDTLPYLAMELLDGIDLGTAVEANGAWPSLPATRAILDASRGLQAAADAGLIHRDVKPSNLVRLPSGLVKVTDFGLAKPIDPGDAPALTAMGVVVGTPDYIAPEQARGEAIDQRVDIYALGGTLYFLLVGAPPFRTGNPSDDKYLKVVSRHLKNPAPDPRARNPAIEPELAALCVRMMSKRPSDRPTYPELIASLEAVAARLAASGHAATPPSHAAANGPRRVEPTPFLGGAAPRAADVEAGGDPAEAAVTMRRDLAGARPAPASRVTDAPSRSTSDGWDDDYDPARPRASRWLVAVTAVCGLLFLTGLGLLLFGPMPEPDPPAASAVDAGAAAAAALDAAPVAAPKPPPGMLLVERPDGTPWLFVAASPVTAGELAAHRRGRALDPYDARQPATRVARDDAVTYARAGRRRLLRADELEAARAADGFRPARGLFEWIDAPPDARGRVPVVDARGQTELRKPTKQADVTFRLGQELP
jgi:serine/threonine-protein kinase